MPHAQTDTEVGKSAVEAVMRAITHTKKGEMKIQRVHVTKAAKTRMMQKEIGTAAVYQHPPLT